MDSVLSINNYCDTLKQHGHTIPITELKLLFDAIVDDLNKNNRVCINQVISTIDNNVDMSKLADGTLVNHELILLIRDTFISLLNSNNDNNNNVLEQTSNLFSIIIENVDDTNVEMIKILFLNTSFIETIKIALIAIATNGTQCNILLTLDKLIDGLKILQIKQKDLQDDDVLLELIEPILNIIDSIHYVNVFNQLQIVLTTDCVSTLTIEQKFFLITCPDYLTYYDGKHSEDIQCKIAQTMLNRFLDIFKQFIPSVSHWNSPILQAMRYVCCILQYISFNDQIRRDYCVQHSLLLDYIINILICKTFVNEMTVKKFGTNVISSLMVYALVYLYSLTFDGTLLTVIKDKQLTMSILNLALTNCKSIQFDAYRTLAMIMNENDVKTLSNTAEIIKLFINYIKLYIDNLLREKVLQNTLLSLKSLVQHEQIKDELAKHPDGIPLLVRCVLETKFNVERVQQRALEILWSMTFNEKAANILTNDQHFMKHVKLLSSTSKDEGVQKTAEGIIWKLEKKDEHYSIQSLSNKYKYDVMISYSHIDKNLCYQIHERLVNDKFCVWFDRDHCYGSHMQEMANAIENAEFVLICMSDSYKQSAYCQSEAHYAYERQCRLIPLIVREKYRPDGWLGFIVSGKVYIDFPKFNQFDVAYQKLLSEINHHRKNQSQTTKHQPITHFISITPQESSNNDRQSIKFAYCIKTNIELWTITDVIDFLRDHKFECMIPLCQNMDGKKLYRMYKMCDSNIDLMYQSLNSELNQLHKQVLPLNIYLCFLDELKKYVPITSSQQQSLICSVM
ncbi:unnamed protein product [Didymodactylos carnosus]|uniref:TIR domain-containing protein n=1 Tax=Didymodactylos carnosus TaxID=1234261 RepID=A0A814MW18_9BILA|nr:unnamed protein product [Didymodactylos carnosus]CAF3850181.1 unnamed protein product [Didymodactylos carnosus]